MDEQKTGSFLFGTRSKADGKEIVTLEGVQERAQNLELILQTRAVSSVASVIRDLS